MKNNIYLARQENTNLYKIGISKNPEKRIKQLQTGNANKIVLIETFETRHGFDLETSIHAEFKLKRIDGEWFDLQKEHVDSFGDICKSKEDILSFMKENNHFWKDDHSI